MSDCCWLTLRWSMSDTESDMIITTAMLALVPRMRWRCDWAGHCAAPCATLSPAPHAVRMNVEEPDDELSSVTKLPSTVERRAYSIEKSPAFYAELNRRQVQHRNSV